MNRAFFTIFRQAEGGGRRAVFTRGPIIDKIDNSNKDDAKIINNQKLQAMHQHPLSHLVTSGVRPDFPPSGVFPNYQD